jgi:hypothetical protein
MKDRTKSNHLAAVIPPAELTDDELRGVVGGFGVEREMKESGEKAYAPTR